MREILSSGQHRLRIRDIKFLIQCETFSHAEGYVHDDGRLLAGGVSMVASPQWKVPPPNP